MEINYLVDLNSFRSAPQLSEIQTKKISEELESKILGADWITVGIMAASDFEAVDALKSISRKYSSIKFIGLDSLHSDGRVFLKANQKTGNVFIRSEFKLQVELKQITSIQWEKWFKDKSSSENLSTKFNFTNK